MTRALPCWIDAFVERTKELPSPEIFLKWSAIATVAATLERRCWTSTAMSRVYPNMFILLVAPPGVGKSFGIREAQRCAVETYKLKMSPDDITKAALIDTLSLSKTTYTVPPKTMYEYHSMYIVADELGVLLPAHDLNFLNVLNILYDNRPEFKEVRRHRDDDLVIENPQINILAGTQPEYMGTLLPPEAWGMGFMTRIMMIYHGTPTKTRLFGQRKEVDRKDLVSDLKEMHKIHGEFSWSEEAMAELSGWHDNELQPKPDHSKLKHYNARRILHVLKLCMISSASRSSTKMIELFDVDRARDWLLEAERLMPEVFKDMGGKSDGQIIQDLHYHVHQTYLQNKRPLHRSQLDAWLMIRTPAYNVENVINLCVSSGVLKYDGEDCYVPGSTDIDKYS